MVKQKDSSLRIVCKKIKIDEWTQEYINKRMGKIEKFLGRMAKLDYEVELSMDKKGKFSAEIMVKTPYENYRAEEISESIEGSVDMAVESLTNQIVKDIDRIRDLKERGARSIKKKIVLDENARFRS